MLLGGLDDRSIAFERFQIRLAWRHHFTWIGGGYIIILIALGAGDSRLRSRAGMFGVVARMTCLASHYHLLLLLLHF